MKIILPSHVRKKMRRDDNPPFCKMQSQLLVKTTSTNFMNNKVKRRRNFCSVQISEPKFVWGI